jgi:flagellar hook assembly protein FlgD
VDGRLVRTLLDSDLAAGTSTVYWDETTDDGNPVASGVYIAVVTGPKLDTFKKIVVIR